MTDFLKTIFFGFALIVFTNVSFAQDETVPERLNAAATIDDTGQQAAYLQKLVNLFDADSIIGEPKLVGCKLSGGTETKCLSITIGVELPGLAQGPWCPRHITDGPEQSGTWFDDGKVYDADGKFIKNLSKFYNDDVWQMYDPQTGKINVTNTKESCQGAARPDVDPNYYNYCVECQISYMEKGASLTYVIPVEPVKASRPSRGIGFEGVGLAFNGARLEAAAPVDAILGAHTLALFDDCGGHVNLHVGYHIHAVTECLKKLESTGTHASMIGIAMDGFAVLTRLNGDGLEPQDLDSCRGHEFGDLGYHYHAAEPGKNEILSCHTGEFGCVSPDSDRYCDATVKLSRP